LSELGCINIAEVIELFKVSFLSQITTLTWISYVFPLNSNRLFTQQNSQLEVQNGQQPLPLKKKYHQL